MYTNAPCETWQRLKLFSGKLVRSATTTTASAAASAAAGVGECMSYVSDKEVDGVGQPAKLGVLGEVCEYTRVTLTRCLGRLLA
jgi:hypothetical protein